MHFPLAQRRKATTQTHLDTTITYDLQFSKCISP